MISKGKWEGFQVGGGFLQCAVPIVGVSQQKSDGQQIDPQED